MILSMSVTPLLVTRDPRAVLASFVPYVLGERHHFLHSVFKSLPVEERYKVAFEGIAAEGSILKPLRECCLALNPWLNCKQVHHVRFEDVVGSQGGGSDEQQIQTLERLSEVLDLPRKHIPKIAQKLYGPGRHTFRKGKIDSWKEDIPAELAGPISIEMADILESWGYSS